MAVSLTYTHVSNIISLSFPGTILKGFSIAYGMYIHVINSMSLVHIIMKTKQPATDDAMTYRH